MIKNEFYLASSLDFYLQGKNKIYRFFLLSYSMPSISIEITSNRDLFLNKLHQVFCNELVH